MEVQRDSSSSPLPTFIDTNALPRHPAHLGRAFERLCELTSKGVIKIYLSEVVREEWKSQLYAEFSEHIEQASKAIDRGLRHPWLLESPRAEHVRKAHEELVSLKEEAPTISDQKISERLAAMNAEILPIVHTHTQLVISSYFAGRPPFKTIKSREDFPDAFIFACAIDLAKKLKTHLFYICTDKKLNDAISNNKNITIFKDIAEFVQSEIVKKEVSRIEEERRWQEILIIIRPLLPYMAEEIKETLKREEPYLEQLSFSDVAHHAIPADLGYAVIEGVYEPEGIEFDWENVNDFGIGSISLPVSFECVADLLINVFRGDVFSVPEGVRVMLGDFEKDVYFEASAQVKLYVSAILLLTFDLEGEWEGDLPELEEISVDSITEVSIVENSNGGIFLSSEDVC